MLKAGDVLENPATGERAVVRVGTAESNEELLVADLYVRPGGGVMGEHVHPAIEESFTVVRGRLGYRLDGREGEAVPEERLHVPRGTVHDWWNAGEEEAQVLVEISPGARFDEMIRNAFGLARDGKTNASGQPHLLQAALFAREFDDVIRFTKPPRPVQRLLFGALAPVARVLGYKGSYPEYATGSTPQALRHGVCRRSRGTSRPRSVNRRPEREDQREADVEQSDQGYSEKGESDG